MAFHFLRHRKKNKKAPNFHLLRVLSRRNARLGYLVLGHTTVILALLITNVGAEELLFSLLFLLLAFRFFRRYFSLSRSSISPSYPGGFFFLSHLFFLFAILVIKSSAAEGLCCLSLLGAMVLLGLYTLKARELKQRKTTTALRESPVPIFHRATTLPELVKSEYFIEKSTDVKLNTRKNYHLVLTNLRLLILNPRTLELHELPLNEIHGTTVSPEKWYLNPQIILLLLLDLFTILILLAAFPPLALILFLLSLVAAVRYLRLTNVFTLSAPEGRLCFSGEEFNAYYTKELVDAAIKECFGYRLPPAGHLGSTDRNREKKLSFPKVALPGFLKELALVSMFRKPDIKPPSQPKVSFGLQNYHTSRLMARKRKKQARLLRLSYVMLFIGIFFYYQPLEVLFIIELLFTFLLFFATWNASESIKHREEKLKRLRAFGQASWERARGGGSGGGIQAEEAVDRTENQAKRSGKPLRWKEDSLSVTSVLFILGWLVIVGSLVLAKSKNDGSLYIDGLFFGLILLTIYKLLKIVAAQEEKKNHLAHEYKIITIFFPWVMDEHTGTSRVFSLFILIVGRLRGYSKTFTATITSTLKPLFPGTKQQHSRLAGPRGGEDEEDRGSEEASICAFYEERGFSSFYHQHRGYLKLGVGFTITILFLAIMRPAFGVRDARINDDDLYSSNNPGWQLEFSETAIDFMKVLYVSIRFYQDEAKDEGYPAMLVLVSLKIPLVELSAEEMVKRMRDELEEHSKDENVIIEKELENGMRKNAEGRDVYYFIYNGTSGDETTFFTKGRTMKNLGAVWRSERNTLHIAIGFAQVSNLSLNNTDIIDPPIIPNPLDTTDETNWNELFELVFKVETYEVK